MATTYLLTGTATDPTTRQPVAIRLAGGGARPYTHLGFDDWRAGVVSLPLFSAALGFDQNGPTGGTVPTTGALQIAFVNKEDMSALSRLFWIDARIEVKVGDDEAPAPTFTTLIKAKVAKQSTEDGALSLTISDLSGDLGKPLAPDRFKGTGGLEGDSGVEDRAKRRSYGRVFNVEGRVLIAADNISEFGDPSRGFKAFDKVRDKGREASSLLVVDWKGTAADTLAALRAAAAPQGGGVVAPSIACVKWWTQPSGPLTADIRGEGGAGYVETPGGIAALIVSQASALVVSDVAGAVALQPATAGIHVEDSAETAAAVLDRLLLGVALAWIVRPDGTVRIARLLSAAAAVAKRWGDASGTAARPYKKTGTGARWGNTASAYGLVVSAEVSRRDVFRPIKSRRVGYQRNYRQHTDAEISAALLSDDLLYPNGQTGTDLQPAEGGADVTANNQSSMSAPAPITLAADYLGNVSSGQLPVTASFRRYVGSVDVSSDTTYSITVPPGVTASVNNGAGDQRRGDVTITDFDVSSAVIYVASTYNGATLYGQLSVTVANGGASSGGGSSSATGQASGAPGEAAQTLVPALAIKVGASGKVTLSFQLEYRARDQGSQDTTEVDDTYLAARWLTSADGSTGWTNAADEVTGTAAYTYFSTVPPKGARSASGTATQSVTLMGLTPDATVYFRVDGRMVTGGVGIASVTGTATAAAQ